ncbi:hypothetical protein D3C80_2188460 [compost metagenome]
MQADQVLAAVGQLAAGQRLRQGLRQAVDQHLGLRGNTQAVEQVFDSGIAIARQDLYQVAGFPGLRLGWHQAQQVDR